MNYKLEKMGARDKKEREMSYFALSGRVEIICGPMFSGKTEELIRRVRRAQIARQKVQIFKPSIDTRYDDKNVVSHSSLSVQSEPVGRSLDILLSLRDSTRIVAIDEVQFFDEDIVAVIEKLAARGCRVICAGLDLDYLGQPFGPMPQILAIADEVVKVAAICTICGSPATRSQRLSKNTETVLLGETDSYEARCRAHYECSDAEEQLNLNVELLANTKTTIIKTKQ